VNIEARQKAEKVLSHTFSNPDLLKEALTHASVADHRLNSNERMEFLGDAILDLIICEALYLKFPEYLEGDLTKVKSAVVSRRTCAEVSVEIGLVDLLIIGRGISSRQAMPSSLAAAVYESLVAAIYLDAGFDVGEAVRSSHDDAEDRIDRFQHASAKLQSRFAAARAKGARRNADLRIAR
jgi:ribonuclease-3